MLTSSYSAIILFPHICTNTHTHTHTHTHIHTHTLLWGLIETKNNWKLTPDLIAESRMEPLLPLLSVLLQQKHSNDKPKTPQSGRLCLNLLHNEWRTQLFQDSFFWVDMLLLLSINYVLLPYTLHSKSNILIFHFNLCKK
jgi:hypothetical protein